MRDRLEMIEINGAQQWILCRGKKESNPVVLFIHGGPGSPLMLFSQAFDEPFLKNFTVVHWDQRGAGKSFSTALNEDTISLNQIVDDGLQVVEKIKKKFKKSKIILVGHSWGTLVASHMVTKRPGEFSQYISVGTLVSMRDGDRLKIKYIREKALAAKDSESELKIKSVGNPPLLGFDQAMVIGRLLWKFGGMSHRLSFQDFGKAIEKNKEYSEKEMETQELAMKRTFEHLSKYLDGYDARKSVPELSVPVYFVHGKFDMATPLSLSREYFDKLKDTQGKNWVTFENSGHFAMYEEPEKFLSILESSIGL